MSRDDSFLYTGSTSASFATPKEVQVKEKRKLDRQTRLDKGHQLKPAAKPILELIQKHKDAMTHVENVTGGIGLTDREAGQVLRSQRLVYRFLVQFEAEVKLLLKETNL